jgi:hypothetical protein
MPMARLREVPWDALRADLAVPAIRRVLAGEAAEREVDRTLRSGRDLAREERAALVEAIFGVALWRRRLVWHAGDSEIPVILLACLLRHLAGLDESRALALTELPAAKKNNYFFLAPDRVSRGGWPTGGRSPTGWKRRSSASWAPRPKRFAPPSPSRDPFVCAPTGSVAPVSSWPTGSRATASRRGPRAGHPTASW